MFREAKYFSSYTATKMFCSFLISYCKHSSRKLWIFYSDFEQDCKISSPSLALFFKPSLYFLGFIEGIQWWGANVIRMWEFIVQLHRYKSFEWDSHREKCFKRLMCDLCNEARARRNWRQRNELQWNNVNYLSKTRKKDLNSHPNKPRA